MRVDWRLIVKNLSTVVDKFGLLDTTNRSECRPQNYSQSRQKKIADRRFSLDNFTEKITNRIFSHQLRSTIWICCEEKFSSVLPAAGH